MKIWFKPDNFPPPTLSMVSNEVLAITENNTPLIICFDYNRNMWCYANMNRIHHTVKLKAWMNIPEVKYE